MIGHFLNRLSSGGFADGGKRYGLVAIMISLLLSWYGFWLARPINFVLADLGRHLTNGRLLVAGSNTWRDIMGSNF